MAINTNRIVPIVDMDLLTIYNMILNAAGTTISAIAADDDIGSFTVAAGNKICNEPATTIDVTAASGTFYFVAAHDFVGITVNGSDVTTLGAAIKPDGATLYSGTISSGDVTIAAITPGEPA